MVFVSAMIVVVIAKTSIYKIGVDGQVFFDMSEATKKK